MSTNGIIFDIRRFAIHDGPGIRTTVFFKGCPLNCSWCHNPEGRSPEPEPFAGVHPRLVFQSGTSAGKTIGCDVSIETVMREVARDQMFYEETRGGVTFSGGEPLMQIEFLRELLNECRNLGLHTAVDTCGYAASDDIERICDLTDLVLFDLKLMDDTLHIKYTGVSNASILVNLMQLSEAAVPVIVRLPMIPDITDTTGNVAAVADFLERAKSLRRIDLLPYNKMGEDKIRRYGYSRPPMNMSVQSCEKMESLKTFLRERGFDVRTGG